jgi:NDP-sugar pyrophosphorylase family protein
MVPFLGRPLIDYLLDLLIDNGLRDVVLTSAHSSFANHLSQSSYSEIMRIRYNQPQGPWRGTASCVREVVRALGDDVSDPYLVVYGDSLLRADLSGMAAFHLERQADVTILYHRPDFGAFLYEPAEGPQPDRPSTNYGVMECADDGLITRFVEKPPLEDIGQLFGAPCANAAAYVVSQAALERLGDRGTGDFASDIFPMMISEGMRVIGFPVGTGYREDVGTIDRYFGLHMLALEGALELDQLRPVNGSRIWVCPDATVSPDAALIAPVAVGARCHVGAGAKIEHSCLADNARVEAGAVVSHCVIHSGTRIGAVSRISHSILGANCEIGCNITLPAGSVVGSYSIFGHPRLIPR